MSQKFSTFVNMINNKSNIEMQLATYKSMLTKASNDLAKSKQLVVNGRILFFFIAELYSITQSLASMERAAWMYSTLTYT